MSAAHVRALVIVHARSNILHENNPIDTLGGRADAIRQRRRADDVIDVLLALGRVGRRVLITVCDTHIYIVLAVWETRAF